jgi:dTDP-glucose 4,6-dehydratase
LQDGKKCTIHGEGTVKRRFLHVRDACEALELLILQGVSGEAYNIGALNVISIMDITKLLIKAKLGDSAKPEEHILHVPDRLFNDLDYNTDSTKLCQLGWKPNVTLSEGLHQLCVED